jgi:hypothetical protein
MTTTLDLRRRVRFPAARRTLLRCALCALPALLSAGCRSDVGAVAEVDPAGVYALESIDGKAVPCSLLHGDTPVPVTSGAFTIRTDGTCTSTMNLTAPGGRDVSVTRDATYTRQGATLTMTWKGFGTTTGTADGDVFSMTNEGVLFSYRR